MNLPVLGLLVLFLLAAAAAALLGLVRTYFGGVAVHWSVFGLRRVGVLGWVPVRVRRLE